MSVVCFSGNVAAVEGDLVTISRLADRAERLFAFWARRNASRTTAPPPLRPARLRLVRAGSPRVA